MAWWGGGAQFAERRRMTPIEAGRAQGNKEVKTLENGFTPSKKKRLRRLCGIKGCRPISSAISETFAEANAGLEHHHPAVTEYQYVLEGSIGLLEIRSGAKYHFEKGDFFIIYQGMEFQTTTAFNSRIFSSHIRG